MGLTEEIIAIIELCVYIPIFPLALVVVFRHGWRRQLGWIYLAIFCLIRIVGAGFKVASTRNPANSTDLERSAILQSIGLSPLLLASMGLLKRITDEVSETLAPYPELRSSYTIGEVISSSRILQKGNNLLTKRATALSLRSRILQLALLPTPIALILCIVGGTSSPRATGQKSTKVGLAIFLVIYALLFALTVITAADVRKAPRGEKRVYCAVAAALPPIAVRLLYSVLSAYTTLDGFCLANGNPWIQLCMAVLEELVVMVMYTLAGLTIAQ